MLQLYLLICMSREMRTLAPTSIHTCATHMYMLTKCTPLICTSCVHPNMYILRTHAYNAMCVHTHAYHTYVYNIAHMPNGLT